MFVMSILKNNMASIVRSYGSRWFYDTVYSRLISTSFFSPFEYQGTIGLPYNRLTNFQAIRQYCIFKTLKKKLSLKKKV